MCQIIKPTSKSVCRYQEAKTLVDLVFGPKLNKGFPRKYLESQTCGNGFYESRGNNNYKHTGVDVEVAVGSQVRLYMLLLLDKKKLSYICFSVVT